MNYVLFLTEVLLLVPLAIADMGERHSYTNDEVLRTPVSSDQVVQLAEAYTGFEGGQDRTVIAAASSVGRYIDTTTPFIREALNGRPAWLVRYEDLRFAPLGDESKAEGFAWSARVWIDSLTGQFLGAEIVPSGQQRPLPPRQSVSAVESDLYSSHERFHGVPSKLPKLSIRDCVEKYITHGVADVLSAQRIEVSFVLFSIETPALPTWANENGLRYEKMYEGDDPIPAWVISLYGAHQISMPGREYRPLRSVGEWRIVFDAETGRASAERYTEIDLVKDAATK